MLRTRSRRLQQLKRQGAVTGKVARCGVRPAVLYGARSLGLAPSHVLALRRAISASLPGSHRARSLTIRLAIGGGDPLHECRAAPLVAWAGAVWDQTMPVEAMRAAWRRQVTRIGLCPRWAKVRGPVGAAVLAARQIGWRWPRHDTFITRGGLRIDLGTICPEDVRAMVIRDSDEAMWQEWTGEAGRRSLAPRPLIEPVANLVKANRPGWTARHRAQVAQVAQGGVWTQDRLFEQGLEDDPYCLVCGPPTVGSAHHRYWRCQGTRAARLQAAPRWQHMGEEASSADLLWNRGLVADPAARFDFRPVPDVAFASGPGGGGGTVLLEGQVFTDGSLRNKYRGGGQAGWAAVAPAASGEHSVVYGPLPVDLPVQMRVL